MKSTYLSTIVRSDDAVIIPRAIVNKLNLSPGEQVFFVENSDKIELVTKKDYAYNLLATRPQASKMAEKTRRA